MPGKTRDESNRYGQMWPVAARFIARVFPASCTELHDKSCRYKSAQLFNPDYVNVKPPH